MQSEYVKVVCMLLEKAPVNEMPECFSLLVAQLDKIANQAKKKATQTNDSLTRTHLQGLARVIDVWTSGDKNALLK